MFALRWWKGCEHIINNRSLELEGILYIYFLLCFIFALSALWPICHKQQKKRWFVLLAWVAIPSFRVSSQARGWTRSPSLQVDYLPVEPPGKPKNTGVGSLSLLHQIFPTQESNQGLLHCKWILYHLSYQGSPLKSRIWIRSPELYANKIMIKYNSNNNKPYMKHLAEERQCG